MIQRVKASWAPTPMCPKQESKQLDCAFIAQIDSCLLICEEAGFFQNLKGACLSGWPAIFIFQLSILSNNFADSGSPRQIYQSHSNLSHQTAPSMFRQGQFDPPLIHNSSC